MFKDAHTKSWYLNPQLKTVLFCFVFAVNGNY